MNCPYCNSDIPNESIFCSKCGKSLYKKCYKCGRKMIVDSTFCSNCGFDNSEKSIEAEKQKKKQSNSKIKRIIRWSIIGLLIAVVLFFIIYPIVKNKKVNSLVSSTTWHYRFRLDYTKFNEKGEAEIATTYPIFIVCKYRDEKCFYYLCSEEIGIITDPVFSSFIDFSQWTIDSSFLSAYLSMTEGKVMSKDGEWQQIKYYTESKIDIAGIDRWRNGYPREINPMVLALDDFTEENAIYSHHASFNWKLFDPIGSLRLYSLNFPNSHGRVRYFSWPGLEFTLK